jgi:hypothetical protein
MRKTKEFTEVALKQVYDLMNGSSPITKKRACEILGISYNTSRLDSILSEYREKQERQRELRKKKRGTLVSDQDKKFIIEEYLNGTTMKEITDTIYRSEAAVKLVLIGCKVPLRCSDSDELDLSKYVAPTKVYEKGNLVYVPAYKAIGSIDHIVKEEPLVYCIWLGNPHNMFCMQGHSSLIDLSYVQEKYNVKMQMLSQDEIDKLLIEGLLSAKRKKIKDE